MVPRFSFLSQVIKVVLYEAARQSLPEMSGCLYLPTVPYDCCAFRSYFQNFLKYQLWSPATTTHFDCTFVLFAR
jgi:hypothetical protein